MSLSVRTLKHSFLSPILILKSNEWYCQRSHRYYCHLKKSSFVKSLNNDINFLLTTHSFCSSNDKTFNDKSGQKSDQKSDQNIGNNNNNNNRDKSSFPKTSIKEDIKGIQLLLI
jgi:hypothetical protein